MSNYEIQIQIGIRTTADAVTEEINQLADGCFPAGNFQRIGSEYRSM